MDRRLGSLVEHRYPRQQRTSSSSGKCAFNVPVDILALRLHHHCQDPLEAMPSWLRPARRQRRTGRLISWNLVSLLVLALLALVRTAGAVYVDFENCLDPNIIHSASEAQPLLQFIPYHVWVTFNDSAPSHTLNVTVYGNISGIATKEKRPEWNDPQWHNDNSTLGKIVDEDQSNNHVSTFFARFNVLDYTPYDAPASRFCEKTIHQQCPLIPAFNLTGNKYVRLSCLVRTQMLTL